MKFKINNKTWEIIEIPQEEMREQLRIRNDKACETGKYYGLTYEDTQTIYLDKDLCFERKRTTLLHELMHCYIITFVTHQERAYNEEDLADLSANSFDIIKEIIELYFNENKINMKEASYESND